MKNTAVTLNGKIVFGSPEWAIGEVALGALWEMEDSGGTLTPYRARTFRLGTSSPPCESETEAIEWVITNA